LGTGFLALADGLDVESIVVGVEAGDVLPAKVPGKLVNFLSGN
jgi:hypothetical protein